MSKSWDLTLQVLFVLALLVIGGAFYFTRIAPLKADDPGNKPIDPYSGFTSVFQFEQEEVRIQTQIVVLKGDYASNLEVYLAQKAKIDSEVGLSDLEKREKIAVLDQLYSTDFFQRKADLIDEQRLKLDDLLSKKCLKYCSYQDLPGGGN